MTETVVKPKEPEGAIALSRKDLPLSCPRPQDELWNMHPRVFLPIEKTGEATCPYCGAHYVLEN